jgi:uncharacterized protein YaiI (UPF0178 family)
LNWRWRRRRPFRSRQLAQRLFHQAHSVCDALRLLLVAKFPKQCSVVTQDGHNFFALRSMLTDCVAYCFIGGGERLQSYIVVTSVEHYHCPHTVSVSMQNYTHVNLAITVAKIYFQTEGVVIWVDADACPGPVKDIVVAAAKRLGLRTVFVANKQILLPPHECLSCVLVQAGADAADQHIAEQASVGDLVITADIPLAHILVTKGVTVIDHRGGKFTPENVGDRLSTRDLMQHLRDSGEVTGGPKAFGDKEKRAFASTLDRELTRLRNTRFK